MNDQSLSIIYVGDDSTCHETIGNLLAEQLPRCRYRVARTGALGEALVRIERPVIVFLDLCLPDRHGFALAAELARLSPSPPRVVALARRKDAVTFFLAGQTPIDGLLWKDAEFKEQLQSALPELLARRKFFPETVRESIRRWRCAPGAFHKILSDRELGLMPLLGLGYTDTQIAEQIGLAPATVKSHRGRILAKLDLNRTVELVHWAILHGFVVYPADESGLSAADAAAELVKLLLSAF